jgi:hypothetical protein
MVLRLDDFTTGNTSFSVPAPTKNGEQVVETHFQEGSMLGGTRLTRVYNALSPQGKPVHLDVSGGRLDLKLDRDQYARLEIGYGFPADGSSGALGLNLRTPEAPIAFESRSRTSTSPSSTSTS